MTDERPGPVVRAAGFAGALVGIVLVAITPNPPVSFQHWLQIVGGAALTAAVTTLAGWYDGGRLPMPERLKKFLRWVKQQKAAVAVAVGVGVVLTAVLAVAVPPAWELARGVGMRVLGCPPGTQLRMVANPETVTTARQLAGAYERWTAGENHDCPTVDVYVYPATTEEIRARARTADGWSDESGALGEIGPRPDVWLTATSHELAGLDPALARATPVALSPVVLAVPSTTDAGTERGGRWVELFADLTDRGVGVVRADPGSTELGLLATALLYGAGGGSGSAGPPPLAPAEVERRIAESLDEGGFPLTDTLGLLCRHRLLTSSAAVIASEQQVARFNLGEPLGESCPSGTDEPTRLITLYPSDSRSLDHQFVRLSWSAPPQAQAAAGFGEWLRTDPGRSAIAATGLRPMGQHPVGAMLTTGGIDPGAVPVAEPIPTDQWDATAAAHDAAQRRGRVLFALDTSGSMAAVGPDGPRSAVAARAVSAALQGMGPRDQFGLWFFPDAAHTGPVEAVPLGPPEPARLAVAQQLLSEVQPHGDTPLFRTMIEAAAALNPDDPAQVDAVVVLTDGEDTSSGLGADAVRAAVVGSDVRLIVVTIGEIRCSGAGLVELTKDTAGECVDADLADLDTTLRTATAGLWGGR